GAPEPLRRHEQGDLRPREAARERRDAGGGPRGGARRERPRRRRRRPPARRRGGRGRSRPCARASGATLTGAVMLVDRTIAGVTDDRLRREALEELGPHGPSLAQDALESGALFVERDVLAWEGSLGTIHAHRVVLALP